MDDAGLNSTRSLLPYRQPPDMVKLDGLTSTCPPQGFFETLSWLPPYGEVIDLILGIRYPTVFSSHHPNTLCRPALNSPKSFPLQWLFPALSHNLVHNSLCTQQISCGVQAANASRAWCRGEAIRLECVRCAIPRSVVSPHSTGAGRKDRDSHVVGSVQKKSSSAEDSYRQHLRLMHETTVGTTTLPVGTFTRSYLGNQSGVIGN